MPEHRLGPSVVGQRIVVRYLLGDGRATDVVGICTSWGDERAVIERDSGRSGGAGGSVAVPLAAIITGKPVPPRASVRQRIPAREAELHTAALFPPVEVSALGDWSIRWEPEPVGRLRKRANSCLAMGSPGMPVAVALDRVREFYVARDRQPIVQVEQDSDVEVGVAGAGWTPIPGDSAFLVASVAQVRRRLPASDLPVSVDGNQGLVDTGVAVGRYGLDGDWVGLHDLEVDPAHRRRGLARQVVAALLDAAAEQGATTAWLHVETDNEAALALYDSLGFLEHHRCRYYAAAHATAKVSR